MDKIKVIYIVSSGHSGSTLLNMILGAEENCFSVGELMMLRPFRTNPMKKCDCGKQIQDCPFWKKILAQIRPEQLFQPKQNFKQMKRTAKNAMTKKIKTKHNINEKLYKLILEEAKMTKSEKVNTIIDSSKDLRRLQELKQTKNIELKVIHLLRDGRAVTNSHEKTGNFWAKSAILWVANNYFIKQFLKRNIDKKNNITIKYDHFAQDPQKYIHLLNKKFNLQINEKKPLKKVQNERFHVFAGNAMRQKKLTEIKYDQKWRKEMPKWKQMILSVLCYIPNRIWVYNENN